MEEGVTRIRVTPEISLDEKEIALKFVRSSGPGGQNVNKVATAVQLRFDVKGSTSLPAEIRDRLLRLAGRRITGEGMLVVTARRFRTQEMNRRDAIERLVNLVRQAARRPERRLMTSPTQASRRRRLEKKRRCGRTKSLRQPVLREEE